MLSQKACCLCSQSALCPTSHTQAGANKAADRPANADAYMLRNWWQNTHTSASVHTGSHLYQTEVASENHSQEQSCTVKLACDSHLVCGANQQEHL